MRLFGGLVRLLCDCRRVVVLAWSHAQWGTVHLTGIPVARHDGTWEAEAQTWPKCPQEKAQVENGHGAEEADHGHGSSSRECINFRTTPCATGSPRN